MNHRLISTLLITCLTAVCSPDLIRGQSLDSLLYLIENNLVKDDAERYDLLCVVIDELYDADSIIHYSDQAIELAQKLDILPDLPYLRRGDAYMSTGNLPMALECLIQAASYYETNNNVIGLGMTYSSMSETYNRQGNHDNAQLYLLKAIDIFELERDSLRLAYALHNLAYFYYSMEKHDSALFFYDMTGDLFIELNDTYAYAYNLGNSGLVYSRLSEFDKAEECLLQAIDSLVKMGDEPAINEFTIEYASIFQEKGETSKAVSYASRVLMNTDDPIYKRDAAGLLGHIYKESGRFDSAYYYQSMFIVANDSIKNIESVQEMANLRTEYEVGKKQAEVDVLEKIKLRNNIIIIGLGVIILLAIGLITLYYTNLKRSRKLTRALEKRRVLLANQSSELKEKNEELTVLNEAIGKQNEQILEANEELTVLNEAVNRQKDEILDSITYAKKIQAAMLPPEEYFHEILNDGFILFKPRDIVSGDFFWMKQVNQYVILAAADCTGHGVPGAFMSLLGISFLNEIVQRREITQANQVLNELRKQIRNSLRQHGQADESKDGIDMALCVIDEKKKTLQYSGANNPLYLIRHKNGAPELMEFKPDRMPLGYYPGMFKTFTNRDIQLEYGDVFYLFSDGYMDQKGGKDNKKFMSKKFKNLLVKIHQEPMGEQKSILDKTMRDWMGPTSQIDDILVMGVRV
jgi:serine phosphatase RsbU (regulator of sigma subunit)